MTKGSLYPRDRRAISAPVLERYREMWERDGWNCTPRGDGYIMIRKRFPGDYELKWTLDMLAKRGIKAWVVGD